VRAEEGHNSLTLPQLEALARTLNVHLNCLLGEQVMPPDPPMPEPLFLQNRMSLRRKIIGVLLRRARLENGHSLEELSAQLGCEPDDLTRIELGQQPIALPELQLLAEALGISLNELAGEDGETVETQEFAPSPLPDLAHLSPELREFVLQPMNAAYLQVALGLSQMPAEALRRFASGLLEITY
jgi:transcriptional regulator with XRE-family HTH domain